LFLFFPEKREKGKEEEEEKKPTFSSKTGSEMSQQRERGSVEIERKWMSGAAA